MVSLALDHVMVSFPGRGKVMDNISFRINDGGIACILGPTGCGKTTTLKAISGIIQRNSGSITIDGKTDEGNNSVSIGYIFQEPRLLPWRSIIGNVEFGLESKVQDERERRERAIELLSMVGLAGREDDSPLGLSGGEKQRVSLARALAPDPKLLLADEPFSSLDIATRRKIMEVFMSVIDRSGKTTIFVTHDLFEALYLADTLIVYSPCPARVKANIIIEDGKPRDMSSSKMLGIREEVMNLLEGSS